MIKKEKRMLHALGFGIIPIVFIFPKLAVALGLVGIFAILGYYAPWIK